MPIRSSTGFDAPTHEILQRVYEAACAEVGADADLGAECGDDDLRAALARRIIELAATGERRVEALMAHALNMPLPGEGGSSISHPSDRNDR
jgi:hypothetical protein